MDVMRRLIDYNSISAGTVLKTPSGRAEFRIKKIGNEGVKIEAGKGRHPIFIPKECLNGIPRFLRGKGWVRIGVVHENVRNDTLDSYVKRFTHGTSAASYVVLILEKVKIIEIDRTRPNKVRLVAQWISD